MIEALFTGVWVPAPKEKGKAIVITKDTPHKEESRKIRFPSEAEMADPVFDKVTASLKSLGLKDASKADAHKALVAGVLQFARQATTPPMPSQKTPDSGTFMKWAFGEVAAGRLSQEDILGMSDPTKVAALNELYKAGNGTIWKKATAVQRQTLHSFGMIGPQFLSELSKDDMTALGLSDEADEE